MKFVAVAVIAIGALAASCRSTTPPPPLPTPTLDDYSPAVRTQLRSALSKAQADPQSASAAGDWGRVLYAYGLHEPAAQAFARARALAPQSFEWAYFLGVVLSDQGKFAEAETQLRDAAQLRPHDLPTSLRLADLLEQSGDLEQALLTLEQLPAEAAVNYRLGRLYQSRDSSQSRTHLERALQAEPDYREALNLLANVYTLEGRVEDAKKQLELFEQADPRQRRHYEDPLLDELDELKARDVRTLFEEGLALQNAGDFKQALARYSSVLEIDHNHVQTHVSLIAVHGMLGNADQAVAHFEQAVASNPNIREAHYNLGLVRHKAGDYAAAAEAFFKVLEISPTDAEAHGSLGLSLEQLGRGAEADKHLRAALEQNPGNPTANFHLGRRLAESGRHHEALPYLERAAENEQSAVQTFVLALVHRQLGNSDQARDHGVRALEQARSSGQTELAARIASQLGL